MFALAGLPAAAGIINFVVLTPAASSANRGIFSTSRMLFGLAREGQAPKRWGILSRNQVPARGLLFSVACLVPSLAILYAGASVIDAFTLRSEEHTSELQSRGHLVCRLLLEKKKTTNHRP